MRDKSVQLVLISLLIAPLVFCSCSIEESNPIFDETLGAIELLEQQAESFAATSISNWPFGEDRRRDWRIAWNKKREPVELQLEYAESTGRLSWSQLETLRARLSRIESGIEYRVSEYQRQELACLEMSQKEFLEHIKLVEFDVSLKYYDFSSPLKRGARDQLINSLRSQGLPRPWYSNCETWILTTTSEQTYVTNQARRVFQEAEWAMWQHFAKRKGIDTTLMSSYLNEIGSELHWRYWSNARETFAEMYAERLPQDKVVQIKDDLDSAIADAYRAAQQNNVAAQKVGISPDFVVKAILESRDGATALIGRSANRWSKQEAVQVGDIIHSAGADWEVVSIDAIERSISVVNHLTGASNSVAMAE